MTELYVPDEAELENMLAARRSLGERITYVKTLLDPVRETVRMRNNYEAEIERQRTRADSMTEELHNLRAKLGDLDPASRNALDQRYDMLGKIKRARAEIPALRQQLDAVVDRMEEALRE